MPDPGLNSHEVQRGRSIRLSRLGVRIFTSHLLAIGIAIALVSFALLSLFQSYFIDALEDSLLIQADLIARSIHPGGRVIPDQPRLPSAFNAIQQQQTGGLSVQIQNQALDTEANSQEEILDAVREANVALTASLQTDVYVMDRNLMVLLAPLDSSINPADYRPAALRALEGATTRAIDKLDETSRLIVATPLEVDNEIIAAFILIHPLGDLQAVFFNLWLRLGASALISLLITSAISLLFARNIQKPVQQLQSASERLQQGFYDYPLPADRQDELGDLSRAFDLMRRRLEATDKMRTQFLSDVAHELRTPLTSIKGLAETLQDGAIDDPNVRDRFLASIERETDRMIRLTRDLLMLTRADVLGFTLNKKPVNPVSLVNELLPQFEVEAAQKSVEISFHAEPEVAEIEFDRQRIEQVLVNLIDNALRYAPDNSQIELRVSWVEEQDLPDECRVAVVGQSMHPEVEGRWVCFSVADEGPGIPAADLPRIFERFFRVERARDRMRGGSGLGLPIAKAIVEAHGGCIRVQSPNPATGNERNPGTRTSFYLPGPPPQR